MRSYTPEENASPIPINHRLLIINRQGQMEPHDPHPCFHDRVLMGPVLRVQVITAYFKFRGATTAMSCQKAGVFRLSLLRPPFWCAVCRWGIEVSSMAGHLGVTSPQYLE